MSQARSLWRLWPFVVWLALCACGCDGHISHQQENMEPHTDSGTHKEPIGDVTNKEIPESSREGVPFSSWWARRAGSKDSEEGLDIKVSEGGLAVAVDAQDNIFITGSFGSTADFGGTTLSSNGAEIFVAKLDSKGNWLWVRRAGGDSFLPFSDEGHGITVDSQGNVLITGSYRNAADFGSTTLTSNGDSNIFVAKLDSKGNWLWARHAGSTDEYDQGCDVAVDTQDNVLITGEFADTASFGSTTLTSQGNSDIFVAKLDSKGNWLWARRAGSAGPASNRSNSVAVDSQGNLFLTGYFGRTADFGSITLTAQGVNMFVAKLDSKGNWLWARRAGSYWGAGFDLAVDSQDHVIISGEFEKTADFGGTTLTSKGGSNIFVASLDNQGNWLWARRAGSTGFAQGYRITVDTRDNIFITGELGRGQADFGDLILTSNETNIFVARLDSKGNWRWVIRTGSSTARGITADAQGNVLITGRFQNTVDFGGTTLASKGGGDIFVWKLGPAP